MTINQFETQFLYDFYRQADQLGWTGDTRIACTVDVENGRIIISKQTAVDKVVHLAHRKHTP